MFSRWGEFAYQHRRVIPLVVVAVIILLYLTFGMRLSDRMSQEGWDDPNSDSTTAAAIEARTFGRDNNGDVILLFTAETGTIDESPEFGHIQEYLTNLLANHPDQIDHITSYFDKRVDRLISQDKRTAFAAIALKGDGDQTLKDFRAIKVQLAGAGRMFPGVSTQIAGATAVADALDEGMSQDISRAEFYALPAVALLLLVVFGSLVAACMPLIVGGLSIVGSLGVLSILAGFTQVNVFAHSVVTLLGLGLAIDYGLFMVSRFREELNRGGGQDVRTAVRRATGTAGKTVVFSAAMVAVALSGLLVFPQAFLKSVAYGAISAVGLAAVLSVTMLPALFSLLGHNIDKFMMRRPRWAGVTGMVAHVLGRGRQGGQAGQRSAAWAFPLLLPLPRCRSRASHGVERVEGIEEAQRNLVVSAAELVNATCGMGDLRHCRRPPVVGPPDRRRGIRWHQRNLLAANQSGAHGAKHIRSRISRIPHGTHQTGGHQRRQRSTRTGVSTGRPGRGPNRTIHPHLSHEGWHHGAIGGDRGSSP